MHRAVTTQAALDAAIRDGADSISIKGAGHFSVSGSATVTAYSATVTAYGSATVYVSGSATVKAYDSATVKARRSVAVHLKSADATVNGGVVIDHTQPYTLDPHEWCDRYDVDVVDVVAKALIASGVPNMGRNRLFYWLEHEKGWIYRQGRDVKPTQAQAETGRFELKLGKYENSKTGELVPTVCGSPRRAWQQSPKEFGVLPGDVASHLGDVAA